MPAHTQWAAGDIEVTMVDSHANLKILSQKRPRQLLKMVAGFQSLRLTILHLNVTTLDQMVLYSVSIKVKSLKLYELLEHGLLLIFGFVKSSDEYF